MTTPSKFKHMILKFKFQSLNKLMENNITDNLFKTYALDNDQRMTENIQKWIL